MFAFIATTIGLGVALLLPLAFIMGWSRYAREHVAISKLMWASAIGLMLATISALFAIASVVYAQQIGGFRFYDPRLLRLLRAGSLLSLVSIVFSIGGAWQRSPLRWISPFCSLGTLLFWFGAAMGE